MPKERTKVYGAIDGELQYQEDRLLMSHREHIPNCNKTTAMYLSHIAGYNQDLLHAVSHVLGNEDTLDVFRKLAALCVACMEFNGGCPRDPNTCEAGNFEEAPVRRSKVYTFINSERLYQDELGSSCTDGRQHTVFGYVIMFQYYLAEAYKVWTVNAGDEYCLNVIRILAAIAVHAMEDHGVIFRVPLHAE